MEDDDLKLTLWYHDPDHLRSGSASVAAPNGNRSTTARRLSAVGFKVYGYKSEPFDEFGDGDRYKVIEGGALEIWHEDGSKSTIGPTRWGWVEEDVPEPEDTARARVSRSHPSRRMR